MRSPLAFRPRAAPLQLAAPAAAATYLASFILAAFLFSDPLLLGAVVGAGVLAGRLAGVGSAVRFGLKIGVVMALLLVVVNALATSRGATVLVRLGEWPLLGHVEVTAEAIAAGSVIGLRAVAVLVITCLYSAAVDPDRVLRGLRPWLGRSALTASLASRFLPLAFDDASRLSEAARLRGPAAAPVGRSELARRLLAGSLDRAVEAAATLELRGYSLPVKRPRKALHISTHPGAKYGALHVTTHPGAKYGAQSRFDRRFWAVGVLVGIGCILGKAAGLGGFEAYPSIEYRVGLPELLIAVGLLLAGLTPMRREND